MWLINRDTYAFHKTVYGILFFFPTKGRRTFQKPVCYEVPVFLSTCAAYIHADARSQRRGESRKVIISNCSVTVSRICLPSVSSNIGSQLRRILLFKQSIIIYVYMRARACVCIICVSNIFCTLWFDYSVTHDSEHVVSADVSYLVVIYPAFPVTMSHTVVMFLFWSNFQSFYHLLPTLTILQFPLRSNRKYCEK